MRAEGVDDDASLLATYAFNEAELAEVLAGAHLERPALEHREPVEPKRAYLAGIAVEGFRGIGPRAELEFKPGPGLTVVAGRNGSGKSSFAEAVEMLLTGENSRWEKRPVDWQSGWRNLHAAAECPTTIEARLAIDGEPGEVAVRRWWAAGATAASASAAGVIRRDGEEPQGLDSLGWDAALATFRPFLPHSEVGSSVAQAPSNLYDAMYAVLGLQEVADAHQRLRQVRLAGDRSAKERSAEYAELLEAVEHFSFDERTAALFNAMQGSPPDPDRIERAWQVVNTWPSTYENIYADIRVAGQIPSAEDVVAAIQRIQAAERGVAELTGGSSERSAQIAALLDQAIHLHEDHGDQVCPVCGGKDLDAAWRAEAQQRLAIAREEAEVADAADRELGAAVKAGRGLVRPIPGHLVGAIGAEGPSTRARRAEELQELQETVERNEEIAALLAAAGQAADAQSPRQPEGEPSAYERLQVAAEALGDAWEAWGDLGDEPTASELVAHLQAAHPPVIRAAAALEDYFSDEFWEIFPKVTEKLPSWAEKQRAHDSEYARLEEVRRAESWLRKTLDQMREERFSPISEHAVRIWDRLSGATNVELVAPELSGAATSRKIRLEVLVDGARSDARGVMSQGELNSLALSLFLPRALLDESPFGFVVIDDPVQAMDPSKVDGLARVLESAAEKRQVVVFTHDDRLSEAIRRLQIEADMIAVTRSENSVVRCEPSGDAVGRYFDDAKALANTPNLPQVAEERAGTLFLRLAIEAACIEQIRRRRIGRGEPHAEVEALLERTDGTNRLVALALFDDAERHGDVRRRIANLTSAKTADEYDVIQASAHTGKLSGFAPQRLLRAAEEIVRIIRAAA